MKTEKWVYAGKGKGAHLISNTSGNLVALVSKMNDVKQILESPAKLKEAEKRNDELVEAIIEMLDSINPHSFPKTDWRTSDFSEGYVGSKGIPTDKIIIKAKQLINNNSND